jgi:hypothetical protein
MANATSFDSPQLDLFSLKRRILEQNITQALQAESERLAVEALAQEFGTPLAQELMNRYPFLYRNLVQSLQYHTTWHTNNVIPFPRFD